MTESSITPVSAPATPGAALISALASGDARGAEAMLAPGVAFSALVPTRLIEKSGRKETMGVTRGALRRADATSQR